MIRYLGIVNYLNDISHIEYIEKIYENLKNKFNIYQKLDLFKTNHINLSNGFLNKSFGKDKYVIMYTGNILNMLELKRRLNKEGYKFSTKTKLRKEKIIPDESIDTYLEAEILITSYHEYKEKFLEYIKGDFSICIYDKTNNIVFLCRDSKGIEPLYYVKNKGDNSFVFSTSIKELLTYISMCEMNKKKKKSELDDISIEQRIKRFKNVYEILPGHYAIYSDIGLVTHKYSD